MKTTWTNNKHKNKKKQLCGPQIHYPHDFLDSRKPRCLPIFFSLSSWCWWFSFLFFFSFFFCSWLHCLVQCVGYVCLSSFHHHHWLFFIFFFHHHHHRFVVENLFVFSLFRSVVVDWAFFSACSSVLFFLFNIRCLFVYLLFLFISWSQFSCLPLQRWPHHHHHCHWLA